MAIKKRLVLLILSSLMLVGCTSNNSPDEAEEFPEAIATPSQKLIAYAGETKTSANLLESIQLADPQAGWVEDTTSNERLGQSEKSFTNKNFCYLYTYPSFQDAVNNDSGSYGDTWTLLGSYAQLGIIMLDSADCYTNLTDVIRFPSKTSEGKQLEVLKPSKETINDCLVRHAACFLDEGVQFPSEADSFYQRPLKELYLLAKAGFCQVPLEREIDTVNPGGLDSCQLASDKGGTGYDTLISQETRDPSILRIAASTPAVGEQDAYGKYLIYGDGWAIYSYNSTEKQKDLFLDMSKVVKGTLVARY